mmetsp:Transcript_12523/g.50326  ORF Transcript_12523/g.50326 Transcript_12523/m.50326 type:complete len:234 (-) Transcript_12523:219-920(-)
MGHHVVSVATRVKHRDRYQRRVERVGQPRHDRLRGHHGCGAAHHHVDVFVGHSRVPARSRERDLERAAAGHDGAGAGPHGPAGGLGVRPVVKREGRLDRRGHVADAVFEHASRARAALLRGLEHQAHRAAELGFDGLEHLRRPEQHRGVTVVAARVHLARDLAPSLERDVGLLRHRQRIHVRAQSHHRGGARSDRRDHSGRRYLLERNPHRRQLALHHRGGLVFRPHQLGLQV